jgi:predicted PurR-regulated permease PerM
MILLNLSLIFRLRLLRFNRRLSLLHLTLQKSARQMLGFLLIFSIVFVAFISLFYLLFYSYIKQYSTWLDTSLTCFEMIALRFTTITDLKNINPLLAGLCLFLFIFLAVFLLSTMFISIIVDNFNIIRQEQLKCENEVELLQFTLEKMKQWLGKRRYVREN